MAAVRPLAHETDAYRRVEAPCPYFGRCGGCTLQDLAYPDQLALKRERLRGIFASLEGVPDFDVAGLEEPWRYRNKAELTFAESNGEFVLGYHAARSFWRIVDIEDCLLLPAIVTQIARTARELASQTGLPPYHPRTHQGFFRHLIVRHSQATGRLLLCLVTAPGSRDVIEQIARQLLARHPEIASVFWGVTSRLADVAVPEELILLAGEETFEDRLGPFTVRLHPMSFLQPASLQADRLYARLSEAVQRVPHDIAWDLYCGIGLVAFYLARLARRVYGIDVEPRHLLLARSNAALNGFTNIEFREGKVETLLADRRFWLQEAKPDLIVVDPPRAGLHPQALSSVLAARPHAIAYLSCNPQSLARDLASLCSSFPRYRLAELAPFDMFPQTDHVEIFVLLTREPSP